MNNEKPNYNLLAWLSAFAVNAEEDSTALTQSELAERLESDGVDVMKLEASTLRRLKKLKAQMDAATRPAIPRYDRRRLDHELLVAGKVEPTGEEPEGTTSDAQPDASDLM